MTPEKYWEAVCRKYPFLDNPNSEIKLTSRGLEKLVNQAYEKGFCAAVKVVSDVEPSAKNKKQNKSVPDFFQGLFHR